MNLCLIQNAQEDVDLETALTDEHRDTKVISVMKMYKCRALTRLNEDLLGAARMGGCAKEREERDIFLLS